MEHARKCGAPRRRCVRYPPDEGCGREARCGSVQICGIAAEGPNFRRALSENELNRLHKLFRRHRPAQVAADGGSSTSRLRFSQVGQTLSCRTSRDRRWLRSETERWLGPWSRTRSCSRLRGYNYVATRRVGDANATITRLTCSANSVAGEGRRSPKPGSRARRLAARRAWSPMRGDNQVAQVPPARPRTDSCRRSQKSLDGLRGRRHRETSAASRFDCQRASSAGIRSDGGRNQHHEGSARRLPQRVNWSLPAGGEEDRGLMISPRGGLAADPPRPRRRWRKGGGINLPTSPMPPRTGSGRRDRPARRQERRTGRLLACPRSMPSRES